VAYEAPSRDKTTDVFILAVDGSWETPAVQNAGNDSMPQWSPDGDRIVFVSDRTGSPSLWTVEIRNGRPIHTPVLIKPEAGNIQLMGISGHGTLHYIAPGSRRSNIYSADVSDAKSSPKLVAERFLNSNGGP